VLLYVVIAEPLGSTAGAIAVVVLLLIGFVGSLVVSMR
jgi:hypothetical protein